MANEQYRVSDFVRKMAEESRRRQESYAADLDAKHKAKDAERSLGALNSGIKKQQNQVNTVKGRGAGLSATKPSRTETQLAEKYAAQNERRKKLMGVNADSITDNKMRDQVLGAQLSVAKQQAQETGVKSNPRAKTSAAKKTAQSEAQKQLVTVNKDKVRTEKLVRYEDKIYDDTFSGQTGANYAVGRLTQDSSLAWSEYLDNPTEKNRRYAEALDATLAQFTRRNEKALDDENVKMSWVSKSLANYIPQFLDQTGAAIQGGIIGATAGAALGPVGWVNGAKAGVVAASGAYSYKTMRGAAFKALIEAGVDEATAREAANDEAFVSALVEMADTGIDMVTFGGAKLLTVLGKSGWKGVGKLAAEWAGQDVMKRFAVVAGKYGLNVASEALEEASQEAVSIANQNRIAKGDTDSSLVWGAAKTFWGALTGKNKEAADQIWAAAEEGAKIAAMMGGADIVTTQTTTKVVSRAQAEMVGAGVRAAGEELNMLATAKTDYDTNTRTHKLAASLESKMKAENRATLTDLEAGRLFEQMARDDAEAQLKVEKQTKKDTKAVKKETKPTKRAGAVEAKVETEAKIDAQTEADLVKLATSENQEQAEYANAQLSNPGATVVSPVAQKLMAAGVKNDVAVEQAALLQKMSAGHKLTEAEIQKLQLSDPAVRAVIESETGVQVTGASKSDKRKLTQSIIKSAAEVKAQEARTRQAVAEQQAGQVIVAQARAEAQAAADAVAPATEAVLGETVAAPAETPVLRDSGANVSVPAGSIEYADGSVQTFEQFAKAYEKRHPSAKATTVVKKFHEYQMQNQMGQKVPGSAKKAAKTTTKPKGEKKASLGDEVTQNVKEAPGEVRRFGKKIMSKEAVVEAKRLEQESLKKFGKFLGVEVEFQEFEGADADANGYYLKAKNTVVLNSRKLSGLRHATRIFLHEVTHPAQDADTNLTKDILNLVKEVRGEEYLNMLIKRTKDAYVSFYRKNNYDLGSLNVASEVAADYMMNTFASRSALDKLAGIKPSLLGKLLRRLGVIRQADGLDASIRSHLDKLADRMVEAQQKAKEQKSTVLLGSAENNGAGARYSVAKPRKKKYNKHSLYSEHETNYYIWAQSGEAGTVRKFTRSGKLHYYQKTEDGCVEISKAQYIERNEEYAENTYRRAERRLGTTADYDESSQKALFGGNLLGRNAEGNAAVFGQAVREKLPDVAEGSERGADGHARSAELTQTEYNDEAADESGASFITFSNDYASKEDGADIRHSIDSEADAEYMDAVERGDMEAAQRMVDEAAKAAGYTTKGYHGTHTPGFTVVDGNLWLARDEVVAQGYGTYFELKYPVDKSPHDARGVYAMCYRLGENLEIDADGYDWGDLPVSADEYPGVYVNEEDEITTNAMAEWAEHNGYDSITFTDVDDGGFTTVDVIFNPNRDAKSADPVTYDDKGNVIPLSERFNETNPDIRYSVGLSEPWVPDWVEDATLLDADLSEMSVDQRDFFADSKARDEHGRLIPMYHGTNTPNFTVFDPSFSDDKISLFFSSNPNVADTYTRQQDEGRDVDPYNLITENSTAEQFNAAQEYVGGGLRVVKITEEWNAEMRQKHKDAEKRYFDGAMALVKHVQELAGDDEVLRNFFNYDAERIKSSVESDLSSRFSMIEGALDNIVNFADAISYQAERTLRKERIELRKLDDVRQMYRDSVMPEEEFGKYLMTETNEMVEFRVEGKENYRFTHFIPGTEKEMVTRAIERSHWVAEHSLGNRYQVYLNLKNPLVVECGTDCSGRKDVNIYHDYHEPDTYYVQLDDAEDSLSVTLSKMELVPFIIRTFDEDSRMKVLNQLSADFQAYKDKWGDLDESQVDHNITLRDVEVKYVQPSYWNSISFMGRKANTRSIAKWAKENGHDGVIFKNLKDTGGWAAEDPGASTVMIAFDSNQVKATTNRKPTEDPDIRYSVNSLGELLGEDEVLTQGLTVTDGSKRYSIRSMRHDIEDGQMFRDLMKHCKWTQEEVDKLQGQLEHLLEIMEPNRDILDLNETFGRDEREFSPYKENSDPLYKISLDFSTLCSKRLLTQYVIENLQLRENRPMSAEEQMAIRDLLIEYGKQEKALQVACTMCYVEAARLKAPEQMNRWIADPEAYMRDYFGKKNKAFEAQVKKAQADFKETKGYDRNAPKRVLKQAEKDALNEIGPGMRTKYKPTEREQQIIERAKSLPASTYLTADNLARLSESEPVIYDAYVSCTRSATRSKALETAVPYYYGDSKRKVGKKGKKVSDKFIESVNRENGMRFSSWSDWRIQHLLDFITAVIENSVRGAAMHGYTKYCDEVRVLGKTGMMFNMSGVPTGHTGLDENGDLLLSPTDSVDIEDAKKARNEFPETSGIQCIGVSDDHIRKLLASDFIDYVIPYHVSGMNADLRRMGGIHKWKDYTETQHAKAFRDGAGKEPTFSEFFVGYNTGLSGAEAMEASAERYKRLCKERGLIPKFDDFAGEKNYWKLLVDRKMVNQVTGQLIEQKPVKADFDFDLIEQIVQKYVDNFDNGLEAKALAYVKKNWDSIPSRIEELKKRDEAKPKSKGKKKKSTPVDRAAKVLANEALAAQPKQYSLNPNTGYEEGSIQDRVLTLLKSSSWEDAMTQLQGLVDELGQKEPELTPDEKAFHDVLMGRKPVTEADKVKNRQKLDDLIEDFGAHEAGEKPVRPVIIPKNVAEGRGVSKHVRTVLESEHTPEWFVAEVERLVAENAEGYTYDIATDAAAMRYVADKRGRGFQRNLETWEDVFNSDRITKNDIALGEFLYTEAVKAGDIATATRLVAELSAAGTRAGQTVQAMSLLKKMTPSGQLYYLQKAVEKLNKDLEKQGKEPNIEIDADLAADLLDAEELADMQAAMEALLQDIANKAPVTVMDKWNTWRYLAMLGNPRTHIRNLASNAVFSPAIFLKDLVGAVAQSVAGGKLSAEEHTKSLREISDSFLYGITGGKRLSNPYIEFADADFENVTDVLRGGGKQNPADLIRDKRPVFKSKGTQWINTAAKTNSQWMEKEDSIFLKWHYVRALSQYLAAQGADVDSLMTTPEGRNQLIKAREWAVLEAQKATFRDASAFASALSRFEQSNKAAGVLVGGLLPFKKTPLNILKRGIEYSPLGVVKMVTDGLKHKQSAARFVDRLAASLTGTGIMALGLYLAAQGLLRGSGSDDDKEKEFEELQGAQNYSLQLGDGTSFTIDWMAPAALPLFVGCEINKIMNSEGKFTAADLADTMSLLAEPMFNLSMLDGLNSTLQSAGYSDSPLTAVGTSVLTGYIGQAVPTLLGQVTRTLDGTRRATYIDKNKNTVDWLDRAAQYNMTKIPGVSQSLTPKLDAWGRTDDQSSFLLGALENFLSPGYINNKKTSLMEDELLRLYKATGESSVLPKTASKYFTVDGERRDLTGEEWTSFQTLMGQSSYQLLTNLVHAAGFQRLSDDEKVAVIEDVYEYARERAKVAVLPEYTPRTKWIQTAIKRAENGYSVEDYILKRDR